MYKFPLQQQNIKVESFVPIYQLQVLTHTCGIEYNSITSTKLLENHNSKTQEQSSFSGCSLECFHDWNSFPFNLAHIIIAQPASVGMVNIIIRCLRPNLLTRPAITGHPSMAPSGMTDAIHETFSTYHRFQSPKHVNVQVGGFNSGYQIMFVVTLHLKENIKKHKSKINIIDQFDNNEMINIHHDHSHKSYCAVRKRQCLQVCLPETIVDNDFTNDYSINNCL
ncbi:hypothetical protein AGLY_000107 [Aphis glycines]|uniref:Uncharacterized protein n=1 Tax=Aphis glycines TaxID=307491 RepID=A0A6G0U8L9_APHGL|nr:hypothetical protein AGLY_000107 [Aphis glycines]